MKDNSEHKSYCEREVKNCIRLFGVNDGGETVSEHSRLSIPIVVVQDTENRCWSQLGQNGSGMSQLSPSPKVNVANKWYGFAVLVVALVIAGVLPLTLRIRGHIVAPSAGT
jgi:hypothetical protein